MLFKINLNTLRWCSPVNHQGLKAEKQPAQSSPGPGKLTKTKIGLIREFESRPEHHNWRNECQGEICEKEHQKPF